MHAYFPSFLRADISKPFSWNRFLTILILNMGWKRFSYKKSCFGFEESRENSFKLNFASEDISQQIVQVSSFNLIHIRANCISLTILGPLPFLCRSCLHASSKWHLRTINFYMQKYLFTTVYVYIMYLYTSSYKS